MTIEIGTASRVVTLDRTKPYGEVWGHAGITHEQYGRYFGPDGRAVGAAPAEDDPPEPDRPDGNTPLEKMHWKSLRKMADTYGYDGDNNTATMIAFLRGKSAE